MFSLDRISSSRIASEPSRSKENQPMKRLSVLALVAAALTLGSASLLAASAKAERQTPRVVRRGPSAAQAVPVNPQAATTATYSAQVNIVTRVQGTSFFR